MLLWRDGLLTAEVEGSEYEPYIIQVKFDEKKITSTDCTCPYDWGGDCKHIIAALLYLCHRRNDIEQRPAVADLIAKLNRDQLQTSSLIFHHRILPLLMISNGASPW